jgi:hypothetical protein
MSTTRGRLVQVNQVVLDQADYFQADGFTRVTGLTFASVIEQLFFNNALQPWPLTNGLGVPDIQITSGKVYFNEVPGSPGIYSVRFRPNAVGYWRLLVTYAPGTQIMAQDYDVTPQAPSAAPGVKSSFTKPCP